MKWFRLWIDILDDPKLAVSVTDDETFRFLINLMAYARELDNAGKIDQPIEIISWRLRLEISKINTLLKHLKDLKIIIISPEIKFLNWDKRQYLSDNSTERVKRFRIKNETLQKRKRNGGLCTETEAYKTETDTETETELKPAPVKTPAVPQSDAVKIYRDIFKLNPKQIQTEEINITVKDNLETWAEACRAWAVAGNRPTSVGGILDWFKTGYRSNKPQGFKSKYDENMDAIKRSIQKAEALNGGSGEHKQIDGDDGNRITGQKDQC
jgi:hypothetical protein